MAHYMLARVKLKTGMDKLARYEKSMQVVRELFESGGIRLRQALVTRVGPIPEVWILWELEDQGHIGRAVSRMEDPAVFAKYAPALEEMQDVMVEEETRYLETLPFFAGADSGD